MSFDEFKGWLRGYLELTDGIHEDHQNRILEELEKVNEVEAAPVVPYEPAWVTYPRNPLTPLETDLAFRWNPRLPAGEWNEENVRLFNEYEPN